MPDALQKLCYMVVCTLNIGNELNYLTHNQQGQNHAAKPELMATN